MSHFTSLFDYRSPENDNTEFEGEAPQREESISELPRRENREHSYSGEDEQNYQRGEYDWTKPEERKTLRNKNARWYHEKGGKEKKAQQYQERKDYYGKKYETKKKKWQNRVQKQKEKKHHYKDKFNQAMNSWYTYEQERNERKEQKREEKERLASGVISSKWL